MTSGAAPGGVNAGRRLTALPAEVTGFVGRAEELARVTMLLGGAQLVTVAGPGGVGKSRLALRAAAAAAGGFPDGVCLIELSRLNDSRLLPGIVAGRLGVAEKDPGPQLAAVLALLSEWRLLLILDTCEHLLTACADFTAAVLRVAPGVTVLATSRQPLDVPGERVVRLGPLPLPGPGGTAVRGDAVELFAQRAASAVPGFTITPANLPDVIRLCRRLDGIPLAIELAAIRLRALPLTELAERFDGQLCMLTGGRRGIVPRHQTLRTAIEWSYQLCTPAERALWNRLSVFAAGFSLGAARDLGACDEIGDGQVAAVLGGLVDKSVVLPYQDGGAASPDGCRGAAAGEVRYRLLDSLREYGAQQLAATGQGGECLDRYLARYLRLAREFGQRLAGDEQRDRLCRLRAEHADIQAALDHGFADPARAARAARLAGTLFPYWHMSGAPRAGLSWQDMALNWFTEPSPQRASALVNRALLGASQGLPEAAAQAREGIAMAARLGERHTRARGYLALHLALTFGGQYPAALEAAQTARRLLTDLGSRTALLWLDVQLGLMYQLSGDFRAAAEHCERALAGLAPGERWLHSYLHMIAALGLYQRPGQAEASGAAARAALLGTHAVGDVAGGGYALEVLAWLAADAGRSQRAAWLLGAAHALWEQSGSRLGANATMEEFHQRAVRTVTGSLGTVTYARLHAAGAAEPLDQVVAAATGEGAAGEGAAGEGAAGEGAAGEGAAGAQARPRAPGAPRAAAADHDAAGPAEPGGSAASLTSREREIAGLVASGLSNREIAARLVISKRTVDAHVNHIFAKLGLSSRVQLAIWLRGQIPRARSGELPTARHAL